MDLCTYAIYMKQKQYRVGEWAEKHTAEKDATDILTTKHSRALGLIWEDCKLLEEGITSDGVEQNTILKSINEKKVRNKSEA